MSSVVIVGAQWGDEGKGKLVDYFAGEADIVLRCQGGANAGHTVVAGGVTHKLHLIPSGILYPDTLCVIGNGVVLDLKVILGEIDNLLAQGIAVDNLVISEKAHLIMPYHYAMDEYQEELKGANKIGTTKRGIGPAYMDKASRQGIRLIDLMNWDDFITRLDYNLKEKNALFAAAGMPVIDAAGREALIEEFRGYRERIGRFVGETVYMVNEAARAGKKLLFEGAQGTLLDIDHGTYPFVTSSSTVAAGLCTGSGVGPTYIDKVLGVAKAYCTRVGSGPFPTELTDALGDEIRTKGGEFGVTTGRARRCGWFDAVVARYSVLVGGLTDICLTKLDIFDELDEIKICVGYDLAGQRIDRFPNTNQELAQCVPVYESLPGWHQDTTGVRNFDDLPANAKKYVLRLEELCGVPVSVVTVGPSREQTIIRRPMF